MGILVVQLEETVGILQEVLHMCTCARLLAIYQLFLQVVQQEYPLDHGIKALGLINMIHPLIDA